MAPVPAHIAAFARKNTYGSAAIGVGTQAAYHALLVWSTTGVLWRTVLACLVGSLPPLFAGLAVHMRALIRREGRNQTAPLLPVVAGEPAPAQVPVVPVVPAPAAPMTPEPLSAPIPALASPQARPRRYPTSVQTAVTDVPADAELPAGRRPPHLTRTLAEELIAQHPDITKKDVAAKLGISDRQLRNVLNATPAS